MHDSTDPITTGPDTMTMSEDNRLARVVSTLHNSGNYSDLTIKCKDKKWRVHRAIILPHSERLAKELCGYDEEHESWVLYLDEEEPAVVDCMIKYLYTSNYDELPKKAFIANPTFAGTCAQNTAPIKQHAPLNSAPVNAEVKASSETNKTVQNGLELSDSITFGTPSPIRPRFSFSQHSFKKSQQSSTRIFGTPVTSSLDTLATTKMKTFADVTPPEGGSIFKQPAKMDHINAHGTSGRVLISGACQTSIKGGLFTSKAEDQQTTPDFHHSSSGTFPSVFLQNQTFTLKPSSLKVQNPEPLVIHTKVYCLADKYQIQALKAGAKTRYQGMLQDAWNTSFFVGSLRLIYDQSSKNEKINDLKAIAVELAGKNAQELLERKDFLDLLKKNGEIATDVLKARVELEAKKEEDTKAKNFKTYVESSAKSEPSRDGEADQAPALPTPSDRGDAEALPGITWKQIIEEAIPLWQEFYHPPSWA